MFEFNKYILNFDTNQFENLANELDFDNVVNGRVGTVIVGVLTDGLVPIVRTTTVYTKPAQEFTPLHLEIIKKIKSVSNIPNLVLNNGLVEIYDSSYSKMKFHTDQSLDLAPNSYICIVSFYEHADSEINLRKLEIQNKFTGEHHEIDLVHNSVVIFSTQTNKNWVHKIVPAVKKSSTPSGRWLGITLRQSNQFVKFDKNVPLLVATNSELKLANEDERKQFCKYKGIENQLIDFEYPEINYTISPSDLMNIRTKSLVPNNLPDLN